VAEPSETAAWHNVVGPETNDTVPVLAAGRPWAASTTSWLAVADAGVADATK
jgi:type II secretory pathway component PulL